MAEKDVKDVTFAGLTFDEVKDLTSAGLPLDQIKELAKAGFTGEQLMELAESVPKGAGGLSKQDLADVVSGAAKAAAEAGSEGMRKVMHPQNARHPGISAFSYPEGDVARPKPTLTRVTYVNGHKEDAEQLSPVEIDAYNSIDRSYTARAGQWMAEIKRNGATEELHIKLPTSMDARPTEPIAVICRELKLGQAAVDPISLAQRVAELETKLAGQAVPV